MTERNFALMSLYCITENKMWNSQNSKFTLTTFLDKFHPRPLQVSFVSFATYAIKPVIKGEVLTFRWRRSKYRKRHWTSSLYWKRSEPRGWTHNLCSKKEGGCGVRLDVTSTRGPAFPETKVKIATPSWVHLLLYYSTPFLLRQG